MTVADLRCDRCGSVVSGPADTGHPAPRAGVRFSYHPGDLALRDDSGLMCGTCWTVTERWLGSSRLGACCICSAELGRYEALHVRRAEQPGGWQLCAPHAADFLNLLDTVEPKLDRDTFRLPLAGRAGQEG